MEGLVTKDLVQALVAALGSPNEALAMQAAMALHSLAYHEGAKLMMMEAGCKPAAERMATGGATAVAQVAGRISNLLVV